MTKPTPETETGRCSVLQARDDVNALLEPLYYIRTCIEALKKLNQATQRTSADLNLRRMTKTALKEARAAERRLAEQVEQARAVLAAERAALWALPPKS